MITNQDRQEAADKAYQDAQAGYFYKGAALKPWSASRRVAAQAMGLTYPFIGEAAWDQLERTGIYPGEQRDMMIFLWLCHLKDSLEMTREDVQARHWSPSRALSCPMDALNEAMKWGEKNDLIDLNSASSREALQIFMASMQGIEASEFRLHVDGNDAPDTSPEAETAGPPKV